MEILEALFLCRKGLPCSLAMIDGLLDGMGLEDADRVLFVDVLPNTRLICAVVSCCFTLVIGNALALVGETC